MFGEAIAFSIRNLPIGLLFAAIVLTLVTEKPNNASTRLLGWVLLLPIGVTGIWAGISHVFFPQVAASHIGWQTSPFQLEVGMADFAIGIPAVLSFWRGWDFRAAAVLAASIFLLGDAYGHVHQMISAQNFAPGNAGVPFYMDFICPLLAIGLLAKSSHDRLR